MYRMQLAAVLAASAGLGGWWDPGTMEVAQSVAAHAAMPDAPAGAPPAARLQGDPADSVYRAAREALNRRDYGQAAQLFASLPQRFPRSGYAPDAYYWRAFALYRLGGEPRLREALTTLRAQQDRFPKASTRGDAKALERRIQGELARGGDPEAAREVTEAAAALTTPPTPPSPPEGPEPPEPPEAPEAEGRDCDDDSDDMKLAALNALIHMNAERAQPILMKVLARRDAGSACLRQKAVFLVAQGGGEGVENVLLQTARSDPDREVREQAVFWLSQVEGETAVAALDSILRSSKDAGVQEKAIFALSQHDSERARAALRGYAERPGISTDLREKAIFWIGQSGGKENEAYLRGLFGKLKEEELRQKVLFSVSQMGGAENGKWLIAVARDRSQAMEIRKQALFWAGQSGVPLAEFGAIYNSADAKEMREQLIFVYSQRDEPEAVDKLLEIARKDPDSEMRKKALFWLGQSDDPRAAKAIQDIIEQP
jgi:TolA-binding protein